MEEKNRAPKITNPKVTMPSGGGALRGISEPFKTQSFTGGGSFAVPFPLPDARGFSPSINLAYNSGSGNGLFGLGFSVSFDSVVRKTSNGIPRYDNTDVFILGSEGELLTKYSEEGEKETYSYTEQGITWNIAAYRPRIESSFALIEQWTNTTSLISHWKVVTPDNITHIYGASDNGRIYNPQNPQQIFEWLIESSSDSHGNKIIYNYKAGDTVNIEPTMYNASRDFTSQRYPNSIQYGNYTITEGNAPQEYFAFEVVFDYGQLNKANPDATPTEWAARPDAFSSYKSGFEIRTARLCNGIYLKHHFINENNGVPFTTSALLIDYETTAQAGISIAKSIASRGYRIEPDGSLSMADTPATELTYQQFAPENAEWQLLKADAPDYFNSSGFMPVDLDGLGIDGLLYSTDAFTGYLEPLGNGKYAPMRVLEKLPVFNNLHTEQVSLSSLDGNSVLDLVVSNGVSNGFFERSENENWKPFQSFANFPEEYLTAEKELMDVSGSGRADLLFFDNNQLKFYPSEGKAGFARANYKYTPANFPNTAQQDEEELLGFSDFLGDGLSHRFCLRNGSLTVWPCLGHGNYGNAITFGNAPQIDGLFNASRVFLIDADGSGATDIVYCYPGFARIWFNQNGNTFSEPIDIIFPATYTSISAVTAGDVCGYGTTSLIFTVTDTEVKHLYYDFSHQQKPYLLQSVDNGIGGISSLTYTTSVLEHLRDKKEGRIWPTRLPISVSVVSESQTTDQITGAIYTQRSRYHDGYFDPVEREFRGFGFVETWDCENYEQYLIQAETNAQAARVIEKDLWTPPIYTRTWFITGAYQQTPAIYQQYRNEFYSDDTQQWEIPAFALGAVLKEQEPATIHQAYSALAGQTIRSEVYAEDDTPLANAPYMVSFSTVEVRLIQPRYEGRYCSLFLQTVNSLSYAYDRNPQDPHIRQDIVLTTDIYGHPLLSASINFPRRNVEGEVIYPEQQQLHVVANTAAYINTINTTQNPNEFWQYLGVGYENRSNEIGGLTTPANAPFSKENLLQQVTAALQNPLDSSNISEPWSRLLGWDRSVYWNNDGTAALPYGQISELALLHHAETVVLSPDDVTHSFGEKVTIDMLSNNCGYVFADGYWWNYGLMQLYNWSELQFYTPSETKATISEILDSEILNNNGFNSISTVEYDEYYLFTIRTTSSLTQDISVSQTYGYDYQALQPVHSVDENNNITQLLYDALGQVIATTTYGVIDKTPVGDLPMEEYTIRQAPTFDDVIANPDYYLQGATTFFYYDFFAWKDNNQPLNSITVTRTIHEQELQQEGATLNNLQIPISIAYSDGTGAALQSKVKTIPNEKEEPSNISWVVNGYTIYNNKGQPVEQYQPYFTDTPYFEDQQETVDQQLVPPPTVIHYDPVGRVIRTDSPKGFFSKTVYTAWETHSYDFNDTMPDSPYYKWFTENYPTNPEPWQVEELNALQAALPCYNTPQKIVVDNLGNAIRTITCNLGAISADTIPVDVAYPLTPEDTWGALLNAGYIAKQNPDDTVAWVTNTFQPYQIGFHEEFLAQFPQNGERLEDYLAQSCLTMMAVYDIQGQQLYNADARLFLKNIRQGTTLYNFRSEYGMGGQVLLSQSADAGTRQALSNMAGNPVYSWDSREFKVRTVYDNFQRQTSVYVSGGDGEQALSNWVQHTVYGETALNNAADFNLVGKPYQDYDESGLSEIEAYSLAGLILQGKTYLRPDYKTEANWTAQAQYDILSAPCYTRSARYNVAGRLIEETMPDGSSQLNIYNINGMLVSNMQKTANSASTQEPQWQTVISNIEYNANAQRTLVVNGNGVSTQYTYDPLTLLLSRTHSTRSSGQTTTLQDIYYTYDPMGHTISTHNHAEEVIFANNQKVEPRSTYTYDPLYRIISAQGRTMPGLNTTDGVPQAGHIGDLQNLVNYTQRFAYDFGDNLILKRHTAGEQQWTQVMTVTPINNQLNTVAVGSPSNNTSNLPQYQYDSNGNMLVLNPSNTAQINWNYQNHIASVTTITRTITNETTGETQTLNDAEYYQYNSSGNRMRKVTERMVQGGTQIEYTEKIYLGNFQQTRTWTAAVGSEPSDAELKSQKNTLIFYDGNAPALVTHVWVKVPSLQTKIAAGDVQYRYQLCDPLNSVTIEVNENAELLTFEQYYVYGGTAYTLAQNQLEVTAKEYRFCGKERDATTGLYYYGARYYAEWLGRWMSPDPAGPVDGPNLYEYVGSNPVNYNDPTGLAGDSVLVKRNAKKAQETNTRAPINEPTAKKTRKTAPKTSELYANSLNQLIVGKIESQPEDFQHLGGVLAGGKNKYRHIPKKEEIVKPSSEKEADIYFLRHLSTNFLISVAGATEVQAAIDNTNKIVYIASNSKQDNLATALAGAKKVSNINIAKAPNRINVTSRDSASQKAKSRLAQKRRVHLKKLAQEISGSYGGYTIKQITGLEGEHAEAKILREVGADGFQYIAGTMRPCLSCFLNFKIRGVDASAYNQHPGAFWDTVKAALSMTDITEREFQNALDNFNLPKSFYVSEGYINSMVVKDTDTDSEIDYDEAYGKLTARS